MNYLRIYAISLISFVVTGIPANSAVAQTRGEIPVPKSLSVDKSLSKSEADAMLHASLMFYAFWNTGKESYLQEAVSSNFFDNTLPAGRPQGYKGISFASANFRKAVPDLRCSVEDLIISKDKVTCRQIYTGHNTGQVMGHPASGKPVRFFAIDILHIKNGKICEDWHLEDNLTFLQQTGVVNLK